jgi:peptidoglycan/LPS O-acetylase OafA/YrhL
MMKHLDPLTGLRGVAAYSVLVAHATHSSFPYYAHELAFQRLSAFGMSLFFVLSGFVIYYNYAEMFRRESLASAGWKFFAARFARLYPLYAVSIIIALPHVPAPAFDGHPWVLLSYLTLTQSWFNTLWTVFQPAWSISTEWFLYLVFVPLLWIVRPWKPSVSTLLAYCAAAALTLYLLLGVFVEPLKAVVREQLFVSPQISVEPLAWLDYFGAPVRVFEFVAGILSARAYMALRDSDPSGSRWVFILAPLWCAAVILIEPLTAGNVLLGNFIFAPALAPFMLYVCRSPGHRFGRMLSSRPLQFMGDISYSVYVWSFFVLDALTNTLKSGEPSIEGIINSVLRVVVAVGLTTVFAYGSFVLIEKPSRRWLRAVLTGSKAKAGAATAESQRSTI